MRNEYYRIRLVDVPAKKQFEVEVKDSWYTKWRLERKFCYRFPHDGTKLDQRQKALVFIDEVMEESVVLYDSRKDK